jgi:hypothetical protein
VIPPEALTVDAWLRLELPGGRVISVPARVEPELLAEQGGQYLPVVAIKLVRA